MPVQTMGILEAAERGATPQMKGARCPECGNYAVIKDGSLILQRLRICGGVGSRRLTRRAQACGDTNFWPQARAQLPAIAKQEKSMNEEALLISH